MRRLVLVGLLWLCALGCAPYDGGPSTGGAEPQGLDLGPRAGVASTPFDARLLDIAGTYESYGSTSRELQLSSQICVFRPTRFVSGLVPQGPAATESSVPPGSGSAVINVSSSNDSSTHGKKLYFVFVQPPIDSWGNVGEAAFPVGQVVVKEAWVPEEVRDTQGLEPVCRKVKSRKGDRLEEHETWETFSNPAFRGWPRVDK